MSNVKKSMRITIVRFIDHPLIGTELEPMNCLVDQRLDPHTAYVFGKVELSKYDSTFLRIDFHKPGKPPYSQFLPWASVGSVLFVEE
jgi:hypothetical protein